MQALSEKKFYPVIHCISPDEQQGVGHALANTRIAVENGADGIFLIGHGLHFSDLSFIYEQVRKQFPETWIGINFLDISAEKNWTGLSSVARRCHKLNALWADGMPNSRTGLPSYIQVFGGLAFKYINPNLGGKELARDCKKAVEVLDVATTSGNKTGHPPEIVKLETIKKHLNGRIPLALASGVNSKNVTSFLPTVDIFLVASSIIERKKDLGGHEYLIPEKVQELANKIH